MATAEDRIHEAARAAEPENQPTTLPSLPRLPDTFWDERSVLAHIRQAAHARNRCADAVLHCVLARAAAFAPPLARIDTGIASPASLNYMVALVDASGGGKSSPEKIARRLLPAPPEQRCMDGLTLGSGEGMAEAFMGEVVRRAPDTEKNERVREQVQHNALFYADEGQVLGQLSTRNGSTLGETIRRAFNGEVLGQQNASRDRNRRVESYALGLVVGMQPSAALVLLDDHGHGTPQRFCWSTVIDPSVPDEPPDWPGELGEASFRFQPLTIDTDIAAGIRREDTARVRGEMRRDPLDAHEPLIRIKLAGLLCMLDRRHHVTREDWRLAGTLWETSCGVRNTVVYFGRLMERERTRNELRTRVAQTLAADRALRREEAEVERVARVVQRKAVRAAESLAKRDLRDATASRDRRYLERAIALALRSGWLVEGDDGRYAAGLGPA